MKKVLLFFLFHSFIGIYLFAQTEDLLVRSGDKGLFIEHKLTPKENFYSIGRLFNVPPKYLASFNSLDMSKGLSIGQVIHIPLMDSNFSQNTDKGVPIYVRAGDKEKLSHISVAYNKVPVESLRKWNNLSSDNISRGKKIIVGFLISGEFINNNSVIATQKEETMIGSGVKDDKVQLKDKTRQISDTNSFKEEKKVVAKEELKKEKMNIEPLKMTEEGYFKESFEQQVKVYPLSKEATVTSGIFKTENGLKDAKYYALIDSVEPGTIIKVTNPSNNKLVYAKVLGEIKGIKQNQGLSLRISNAAASALEISDTDKFIVKVNY